MLNFFSVEFGIRQGSSPVVLGDDLLGIPQNAHQQTYVAVRVSQRTDSLNWLLLQDKGYDIYLADELVVYFPTSTQGAWRLVFKTPPNMPLHGKWTITGADRAQLVENLKIKGFALLNETLI